MQEVKKNPFLAAVLREIPRLLGQIDRNPLSQTHGSCDRAFWLYRTNDISSIRYQEAALTLALLYATPFDGNEYRRNERIRTLANAVIHFACRNQKPSGSFDEWYVNEGSFVCTAFVMNALADAALLLGDGLDRRADLIAALRRSAAWLSDRSETLVVNQLAGAVAAFSAVAELTGDKKYARAAEVNCKQLLALQSSEGWWSEYGGPDAGYLSLTVDYLSRYNARFPDSRVENAIEKASAFLLNFVHPDGTVGGEYLARNTEYLIPSGFTRAARYSSSARKLVGVCAGFLIHDAGIVPRVLDDRYLCYILYNWLEAGILWERLSEKPSIGLPEAAHLVSSFPESGLFAVKTNWYQLFGNLKKGGSMRLYANDALLVDSGIAIRSGGVVYAGNTFAPMTHVVYDERALKSTGTLLRIDAPLLTTLRAVVFKLFQLTFGRLSFLQKSLKHLLRARSIMRPGSESALRYERAITFSDRSITITDTVDVPLSREELVVGEGTSYALVPSSRFAATQPPKSLLPTKESFEVVGGASRLKRTFVLQ